MNIYISYIYYIWKNVYTYMRVCLGIGLNVYIYNTRIKNICIYVYIHICIFKGSIYIRTARYHFYIYQRIYDVEPMNITHIHPRPFKARLWEIFDGDLCHLLLGNSLPYWEIMFFCGPETTLRIIQDFFTWLVPCWWFLSPIPGLWDPLQIT